MSLCPVPLEQQPLQEYRTLRDSWFYCWPALSWGAYVRRLLAAAGLGALVALPVAAASFDPWRQPWLFGCASVAGAGLLPSFLLLRLYLGWRYVQQRLASRTIVYEESGWYDGRTWEKPPTLLAQERLVSIYEVGPLLRRLRWSLAGVALLYAVLMGLGWLWR
ncbi:MAG: CGLD27 family protein [Gloeomargarita sp. SKYBB_i_bin120]|nr:CGLD27 family protein [Gloeomargarita sp. SKYG98]MCS7291792.1 CGLD27 family protein [Gloeomargarita sp. SKYB120]MDW8177352.1 CGLD27 family protein [Gloeomargarita sp. SKYBB_i_bin120]